jgi:hypothetical protein
MMSMMALLRSREVLEEESTPDEREKELADMKGD